jgi:hypothetical protein
MKKLTIRGMHCDACKALITMDVEDAGMSDRIKGFGEVSNNQGELLLKEDVSDEELKKLAEIINSMDNYQVL